MQTSIKTIGLLAALAMGLTSPLFSQVPDLTKGTQSVDRSLAATPPQLKPPLHGLEEVGWQNVNLRGGFSVLKLNSLIKDGTTSFLYRC